ncbi:helix-turn-helix domain-containing protein [Vibrio sp. 99-8-1]|uniref:helix-turn-helix domain-containing protein n=1 Tax=Vibrio sp. 99-8-1 TaxID=2607602 RepID=UPI001493AC25|nr:helix-turn-helix domain-containing protein [Vibrio sp. 99-8-1]NOI67134.1 AraC family transcriptional regulator [Vibrio sp. 99-8-1]
MFLAESLRWEISLIGLSLTLFTLANVLTKPYKHHTDWQLCVWLIFLNVPFIHSWLSHLNIDSATLYLYTNPTLNLVNGPMLYLYVRTLINNESAGIKTTEFWHFAPFLLFYLLYISTSHPEMMPQPDRDLLNIEPVAISSVMTFLQPVLIHFGFINVISFVGYSVATIVLLNNHQKKIPGFFSQNDIQVNLKWIYALPGTFATLALTAAIFESVTLFNSLVHPLILHLLSFLCFVIILCFFGLKQKPVFQIDTSQTNASILNIENKTLDEDKNDVEKTNTQIRSELEQNDSDKTFVYQTIEHMNAYMKSEKPFMDPDFSVYTLASSLNIPRRMLSQVLSTGLSKNFYQYVNEFRIEEVKFQLANQTENTTILDIAFQAGFKSKSSFNSLFKQHCDITPSQYRKKMQQQNDAS